jgi:hypothetical protein
VRHYILRCVAENVPALKVPRQCPLVPLVNIWCRREIKAFGSYEAKVMISGSFYGERK